MITAEKVKAITENAQIIKKSKKIEEILLWCESKEKAIIESAQIGKAGIAFPIPHFSTPIFTKSESISVIRGFFIPLGYKVSFTVTNNVLFLEW